MTNNLRGKVACVGLATAGTGEATGRNAMDIMVEASYKACKDAGISIREIDGVFAATAFHSMPTMSLCEHLGIHPKYSNGSNIGGSSFMAHALNAVSLCIQGCIH